MFRERPYIVILFSAIVVLTSAVLQYLNPGLNYFDAGLITAILLTVFLNKDYYTYIFGGISIFLVGISVFYPHGDMSMDQVIMQHAFSAMLMLMTIIAVLYVKKLYRSMETDQQQVTALFEHATEGIILTNQKGAIVLVNPAASRLFKYEIPELIGKPIEVLIPRKVHPAHSGYRAGYYKSPSARSMGHGRDLKAVDKNGKEFPVEVSLSHYRMKSELFVIAFIVDITERKMAEKSMIEQQEELEKVSRDIRRLNAELEIKVEERTLILKEALHELEKSQEDLNEALSKEKELSEIKSRFVSMASHEFRTPLSSILSSAALLSRYTKTEEQDNRDRHIRRIKDSVKHLNDLLEDFLSLGKLEEGKIMAKPERFNVKEFIADVADETKAILKKGQHFDVDCGDCADFYTDKKLLKNALINLVSNAVKFSDEEACISIRVQCQDAMLELMVKDQGIGISEDDQDHLFSSFFRGKNALNIQGTGLGLHIVKRYVDLMEGTIELQSELNKGTTITLRLPSLLEEEPTEKESQ